MEDKNTKYTEAVGRRKTSVARVRISPASKTTVSVNDKDIKDYFPTSEMELISKMPLTKVDEKFKITAKLVGGGIHSQSEALRHGISRAIVKFNSDLRKTLKIEGFLKRDPRMKERRKFGLKKARKAPQWSKR